MNKVGKNFWLLFLINALIGVLWMAIRFFFAPYLDSLGFSGKEIGWFFGLSSISAILFLLPAGISSDRFTPKNIGLLSSFFLIFINIGFYLFHGFFALSLLFVVFGVFYYSLKNSINTELLKRVKNEYSGKIFGLYNFFNPLLIGLGMILSGFFINKFQFKYVFIIQSVGFLVLFFLLTQLSRLQAMKINLIENINDLKRQNVLVFIFVLGLFASHWGAEDVAYGIFLKKNLGLSSVGMGFYMAGELLFMAITVLIFGNLIENKKTSLEKMFFWGLFLSGLTHILMVVPIVWLSATMRMIHGIGDGIMGLVLFVGLKKFFKIERIGSHSGLTSLIMIFGSFIGQLIYGLIGGNFGFHWPLIISGAISLSLIFFVKIFKEN